MKAFLVHYTGNERRWVEYEGSHGRTHSHQENFPVEKTTIVISETTTMAEAAVSIRPDYVGMLSIEQVDFTGIVTVAT